MKTTTLVLILFLTAHGLWAQTPTTNLPPGQIRQMQLQRGRAAANNLTGASAALPANPGFSAPSAGTPASGVPATTPAMATTTPEAAGSPDSAGGPGEEAAGYKYDFPGVDVNQILDLYADLVGRTLIRGNVPAATITLKTQSPLTKTEAIEAFQAVLALNGVALVNIGEKFVKVLPPDQAGAAGGSLDSIDPTNLPDMGSYVTVIKQLKFVKPSVMLPIIQPFGRLANSITPIDDNGILVIRDYAENVKRMLEMIARIDISVPAEYISEVIPIRYAKVDDIANALNSLGGSGSATVSIGSSTASPPISGIAGNRPTGTQLGGMGSTTLQNGLNTPGSPLGATRPTTANPNGTPSSATPFQQRLQNIINRAGEAGGGPQQPIQLFGQTKIIPNESSSSLLIYATRQDMDAITNIIAKLDVPLAQVLIEAVIVNYTLGNTFDFGVSAVQNQKTVNGSNPLAQTVGGMNNGQNNGQTFFDFLNHTIGSNVTSSASSAAVGNSLPSGLSYFGSIGPTWEVALNAAQSDSHASIIQRPRIQTSQAIPAQFFVGSSVPYITGNYSYYGGGPQNSYSQLSVGVELDVTPFINPEGAVTMQIAQEIDAIDNPNYNNTQQPSTVKRTLNTTITVRDKDTVMLGGFIEADKSHSQAGVPFLSNIPLLGNLFKQRDDQKTRKELIVLMRPTVLGTPELAAKNTLKEEQRLPGVSAAYAEDVEEQNKAVEAERKKELSHPQTMRGGFYNPPLTNNVPAGQLSQPQVPNDGFFTTPPTPYVPVIPANTSNPAPPPP
jgi:general secretion pathway protein D